MRDINFFSIYSRRKNGSTGRTVGVVLGFVGFAVVVGGIYVALNFFLIGIRGQIKNIDNYLQSDAVREKAAAVEAFNANTRIIEDYAALVEEVLANLEATDYINAGRLDEISAALPVDVVMDKMAVTDNAVEFVYTVADLSLTAQLIAALSGLDCFESVALAGAESAAGGYQVTINAVLRGGDAR